jgi:hypothetical protein
VGRHEYRWVLRRSVWHVGGASLLQVKQLKMTAISHLEVDNSGKAERTTDSEG